jgi:hypothetical protein
MAGLVLNPRYFGGPRIFCRGGGGVPLSWYVPIIASGTRVSPLHYLAVLGRCHACIKLGGINGVLQVLVAHIHQQVVHSCAHILLL